MFGMALVRLFRMEYVTQAVNRRAMRFPSTAFTLGCVSDTRAQSGECSGRALINAPSYGGMHCMKQVLIAERLAKEIDCACLHGLHAHKDVCVAGDENDGQINFQLLHL
jgi:hypothetical protein